MVDLEVQCDMFFYFLFFVRLYLGINYAENKFKQVTFELTKFILGTKAEESKKTEKNSLSLNFNTISDVLYPSASHP